MTNTISVFKNIQQTVADAVKSLYGEDIAPESVQINNTPKEFSGDYTVVIFPFVKLAKKSPDVVGAELGAYIEERLSVVESYNVVKGFLNLVLSNDYWHGYLSATLANDHYGRLPRNGQKLMIEYSSPNTNKPLHLGHVRNCLLGYSCSKIMDAVGFDVVKAQIINDRGVAICKSMVSWKKYGAGATPESTGTKGDHFVGDYYVKYEVENKAAYLIWQSSNKGLEILEKHKKPTQSEKEFFAEYYNKWGNEHSDLGKEVREMLLQWEAGDPATIALWKTMNGWVYSGFDITYKRLGVDFDHLYYESDTYLLGKEIVAEGLEKGVFQKKEDGTVIADLTDAGHDVKIILRSDGTSMYITQDLGTARMRYGDLGCERMVYVVADEQNRHFAVLFEVLKRLGEPYAAGLHHLAYGLVELPTGRMKTREGTVVDADDLMDEVQRIALAQSSEGGTLATLPPEVQAESIRKIGLAALKFSIIKVNPKKKMIFNPEEAVDLQGQTGPYIQYSYVRIHGLMQRVAKEGISTEGAASYHAFEPIERELMVSIHDYPATVLFAAEEYDPSHIANYCYNLAKTFHRFWHEVSIFGAADADARAFRLQLSRVVGKVLLSGMDLLGIEMPERM